jgi:hypothetical protein
MLFSDASDECVEVESGFAGSCTGVCAAFGSVALKVWGRWSALSRVHRQLWELQLVEEWIELDLPAA